MQRTLVKQSRLMSDDEWHGRSVRTVEMPLDRLVAKEVYKLTRARVHFERVDGFGWTTLEYKDAMGNVVRREFSVLN